MAQEKFSPLLRKIDGPLRRKKNAEEVLELLVLNAGCSAKELLEKSRSRLSDASFQSIQLERILGWGEEYGLVFRSDGRCFATSLAKQYFESRHGLDWLDKALLSLSIIADTRPKSLIPGESARILSDRLGLTAPQADLAIAKLSASPRRLSSPRLANVLSRGRGMVLFAPTIFPKREGRFETDKPRRDCESLVPKQADELIHCPRMDFAAEKNVLGALRGAGFDDVHGDRLSFLSLHRYRQICSDCAPPDTHRHSVISMSSPTVNPFTLDLLLRCESRAYFSDTVRKIITPTRVEEATVEKDKGLIVRLVDPQTGLTHFVIAGLYPPGTLAAAVLFRAKIEDFLGKYEEEPFFVLLETDRLVDDQWADEYATDCRILEERSFSKCAAARRIEMPLQHAWQLLVDFAKQYPFYFRQRIDDVSFGTLFRESNVGGFTWNGPPSDLSAASYLMGALSVKGKLIESVTDCVLYHIFNSDSNTFKELFHTDDSSCVRNTLLAVAEKNHNLMDRITHLVVELALNQELQVRERISLYSHLNVANRVITHLSEPFEPIALHVPAKIAVGET